MKKGISLMTVIIAVSIMIVLIASVSVIGSGAISSANFEEYKSQIERIADEVNIYYVENGELPVTGQVVDANSLGQDFLNSLKEKNDLSNRLYVLDVSKLNDFTFEKGKGSVSDKDVFLVTQDTNNVYYLKGFKYRGDIYFTY